MSYNFTTYKGSVNVEKGIIVTSFGTSYEDARKSCIEPIENKIREEFDDYLVIRAFTSRVIISRLKKRDDYTVLYLTQALEHMKENGISDIYIQPLLIISGKEYDKISREVTKFMDANPEYNIKIGKPLLTDQEDYENAVDALDLKDVKEDQALVLMGHGTSHDADYAYGKIDGIIKYRGHDNVFVATLDGVKTIERVISKLKEKDIDTVKLRPFMLVAGDHAKNDMASDDEDSWKSVLEKNDIKVNLNISGLGQVEAIQDIFKEHLRDILI